MKARKKKALGLLGLFSVVAITTVAVFLPQTGVFATTSVTDTITITVTSKVPKVEIISPKDGERIRSSRFSGSFSHENINDAKVCVQKLEPAPADEDECAWEVESFPTDPDDLEPMNFDVDMGKHGLSYGRYKLTVKGESDGVEGATSHSIEFFYNPIDLSGGGGQPGEPGTPGGSTGQSNGIKPDQETKEPVVNPHVIDPNVGSVHVNVFRVDGEGTPRDPNQQPDREFDIKPNEDSRLGFTGDNCGEQLPAGWYQLEFQAKGKDGSNIGLAENVWFHWEGNPICQDWEAPLDTPNTGAPNTGGLFGNLNVSREDSLITVAIVFAIAAVLGAVFVVRRKSTRKNRR